MNPEQGIELVVAGRSDVADSVVEIVLCHPHGEELPAWSPGAHTDLLLDDATIRQYSLCGDVADRGEWRIAVARKQAGRGGSAAVHDRLWPGTPVRVNGPRNHFALQSAAEYLFVAGGIGITPMIPMMAHVSQIGAPWTLVFGGRTRSSMPYGDRLLAHYGPDHVTLIPQDKAGRPDLSALLGALGRDAQVYCCGPPGLLDAAAVIAETLLPPGNLKVERFSPKDLGMTVEPTPFELVLQTSGLTLTIPADRTIIEVLEESGMDVAASCEGGTCGACITRVVEGVPDHRDSMLTDAEQASNSVMTICCSRAVGRRLVLDL